LLKKFYFIKTAKDFHQWIQVDGHKAQQPSYSDSGDTDDTGDMNIKKNEKTIR
jgi:hypothetical protein